MTSLQPRVLRPGRGIAKEVREVCNHLIDTQGWRYIPKRGAHPRIVPPDPDKPIVSVLCTPSDWRSWNNWLSQLRASGADLSEPETRDRSSVGTERNAPDMTIAVDSSLRPISTVGQWWHPSMGRPDEDAPLAPVVELRPKIDHNSKGEHYTLGQARMMLRQGYHVSKVVEKTGWGRNWFSDLIDATGYLSEAQP